MQLLLASTILNLTAADSVGKNPKCIPNCESYLKQQFQAGNTAIDRSEWCEPDSLNLCNSGNCYADCKFNFHEMYHENKVDCDRVCEYQAPNPTGSKNVLKASKAKGEDVPRSSNKEFQQQDVTSESGSAGWGAAPSIDTPCDMSTGGMACCDGKGLAVIDTKDYCEDLKKYGECHPSSCFPVQMNPNVVDYCCRNPKGAKKFPRGHPKLPGSEHQAPNPTGSKNLLKASKAKGEDVPRSSNKEFQQQAVKDDDPKKNPKCEAHCSSYLKQQFQAGNTAVDRSSWCTPDSLALCGYGMEMCMDNCNFNIHGTYHENKVNCNQVCQFADAVGAASLLI